MEKIEQQIAEAKTRLMKTQKGSKCYKDTCRWLNKLYDKRAKMIYKGKGAEL